jgi:hypothetical protein
MASCCFGFGNNSHKHTKTHKTHKYNKKKMTQFMSAAASALASSGGGGSLDSEFREARYKDFSKLWSVGIRKNVGTRYFGYI